MRFISAMTYGKPAVPQGQPVVRRKRPDVPGADVAFGIKWWPMKDRQPKGFEVLNQARRQKGQWADQREEARRQEVGSFLSGISSPEGNDGWGFMNALYKLHERGEDKTGFYFWELVEYYEPNVYGDLWKLLKALQDHKLIIMATPAGEPAPNTPQLNVFVSITDIGETFITRAG